MEVGGRFQSVAKGDGEHLSGLGFTPSPNNKNKGEKELDWDHLSPDATLAAFWPKLLYIKILN